MEWIGTEEIITALLIIGFDKIDPLLFTYTLANVPTNSSDHSFKIIDKELSQAFKKYVDNDRFLYKLKEGIKLETEVLKLKDGGSIKVIDCLEKNKELINFLYMFDFSEVVKKKACIFGFQNESDDSISILSKKEKEIFTSLNNDKKVLKR